MKRWQRALLRLLMPAVARELALRRTTDGHVANIMGFCCLRAARLGDRPFYHERLSAMAVADLVALSKIKVDSYEAWREATVAVPTKHAARVAELEARIRELTEWRSMETIPHGEPRTDDDGDPYILLTEDAQGVFRVKDSKGSEYLARYADGDVPHEWHIWTGDDFVALELEEGVTLVGWLPGEVTP